MEHAAKSVIAESELLTFISTTTVGLLSAITCFASSFCTSGRSMEERSWLSRSRYGSEASVAHADALWRRLEQTVVWGEVSQGDADGGGAGGGSNRLQSPDFEDFNEDASEMGASKKKRGKKTGKEWAKAHCSQGMQAADGSAPGRSEQERWCASKAASAAWWTRRLFQT